MEHGGGGGVEEIEGPVAVSGDVHGVAGDAVEAEVGGDGVAVEGEAGAGEGAAAEGAEVDAGAGLLEAFEVAEEHLEVGEAVVGPEDGLGAAEVGIAVDDGRFVAPGEGEEFVEEGDQEAGGGVDLFAEWSPILRAHHHHREQHVALRAL